jgi:hypothetical protein
MKERRRERMNYVRGAMRGKREEAPTRALTVP